MALTDDERNGIISWARKHPEIEAVYLYGSRARGTNRPDSDIDLAVAMDFQAWFQWIKNFRNNPDLHLSNKIQLEWYQENARLDIEGGIKRDGVLIYKK